jgi:nitrogen-specific signal transduction histidine kinase
MATHDVINCLASVKSLTELLADYPRLKSDDRIRFLSIICEEADRLADLLAELTNPDQPLSTGMVRTDKPQPIATSSETP